MRSLILRMTLCLAILLMLAAGWTIYTHQAARLDLSNDDDAYTAAKSIGIFPASREIYAECVGFLDPTLFFQAVVKPD
jgi:hypothetical protein